MKLKSILTGAFTFFVSASITLMVITVFMNAVLRYAFNSGIPAGEELARYFFIWITALGTVLAYKENKHIGVDLLTTALKGIPRTIVIAIGRLITILSFSLVGWGGVEYFKTSAASPGPATGIPFGYVSVSIIVVAVSIIALTVQELIKDVFLPHGENQ